MTDVPPAVRSKALAVGAEQWLDDLPDLIADLERDWSISVGRPYGDPTEAFVAEATLADGTPAVLKLVIPRDGNHAANEATVLRIAGGDGCVRMLREDLPRGALLLERLGRSLAELGLPLTERLEILCATASRVWRQVPDRGLPSGADKAAGLAGYIPRAWDELGRPCSERAVDYALACAAERGKAHDDERAVLVHGDVHQWNTLEAAGGYKLVDPDGLLAEAECDLGVLMREDPEDLLHGDPRERARWLARRCGLDAHAIWQWGAVERVATGLVLTTIGLQPVAAQMLAVADRILLRRSAAPDGCSYRGSDPKIEPLLGARQLPAAGCAVGSGAGGRESLRSGRVRLSGGCGGL
ncbi:MAG TPA: aminoglycoside phosphotransferase family protein, partial [Streptosporangiaceae bacterium]|nr:aminoglycoside phosphotransferase family protein [Streptosporangiaceae bacterium]